ncbi:CvpA family protein [Tropicibacter alexandrii]|uniref:CvpA family protein n=1 Tax=Tropicibacter alexandrii TaxID=2267683 RepID=UPI000EF49273|nr:CvpA family protein [Tropicibacter alexandrii]
MEGFTIVDGVVAGVIFLSAILAYSRGLVREVLAIGGWIVSGIMAYMFAPQLQPLVKEAPVVGKFFAESCEFSMVASFFVVLTIGLVVMSLFTPLFSSLIQRSVLGGIDQALGFLFGAARGILLAVVAFFVYETVITSQDLPMVDDSRTAAILSRFSDQVAGQDPEAAQGWVYAQYNGLMGACDAPGSDI